jgi:hypothetical protein
LLACCSQLTRPPGPCPHRSGSFGIITPDAPKLAALPNCPALHTLNLRYLRLQLAPGETAGEGAAGVLTALPALTELHLSDSILEGGAGEDLGLSAGLAACSSSLRVLHTQRLWNHTGFMQLWPVPSPGEHELMCSLTALARLEVGGSVRSSSVEHLSCLVQLRELVLQSDGGGGWTSGAQASSHPC